MSIYPDFSSQGYQVIDELRRDQGSGRITYLATTLNQEEQIEIAELSFANSSTDWSSLKASERQIELLQQIDHPRIPRHLNIFKIAQSFWLVREYKNIPSLSERNNFDREEIKQIAVSVLEILVYLQTRTSPIVNCHIKPDNILVDDQLNAFLVDFSSAQIVGEKVTLNSLGAETPGFIPPESQFGHLLTKTSDLYSLGATLICLLTNTRQVDIGKLIASNNHFNFSELVPQLSSHFVEWLNKMVEPNLKNRYFNAASALKALQAIQVFDSPTISASKLSLKPSLVGLSTFGFVTLMGMAYFIHQQMNPTMQWQLTNSQKPTPAKEEKANLLHLGLTDTSFKSSLQDDAAEKDAKTTSEVSTQVDAKTTSEVSTQRDPKLVDGSRQDTNLGVINLEGANLEGAKLEGAILNNAILRGANLRGVNLRGVDLRGANLEGVNLQNANLENAILQNANLKNAILENANLKNANLRNANLENANLKGMVMPERTKRRQSQG